MSENILCFTGNSMTSAGYPTNFHWQLENSRCSHLAKDTPRGVLSSCGCQWHALKITQKILREKTHHFWYLEGLDTWTSSCFQKKKELTLKNMFFSTINQRLPVLFLDGHDHHFDGKSADFEWIGGEPWLFGSNYRRFNCIFFRSSGRSLWVHRN